MAENQQAALLASLCPDCEAPMRCTGTRTWREGEWERIERTYVCDNHGVTSSTARHVGPAAPLACPGCGQAVAFLNQHAVDDPQRGRGWWVCPKPPAALLASEEHPPWCKCQRVCGGDQ